MKCYYCEEDIKVQDGIITLVRGVYVGPDETYREFYNQEVAV